MEILSPVFFTGTRGFPGQSNSLSLLVALATLEGLERLAKAITVLPIVCALYYYLLILHWTLKIIR